MAKSAKFCCLLEGPQDLHGATVSAARIPPRGYSCQLELSQPLSCCAHEVVATMSLSGLVDPSSNDHLKPAGMKGLFGKSAEMKGLFGKSDILLKMWWDKVWWR